MLAVLPTRTVRVYELHVSSWTLLLPPFPLPVARTFRFLRRRGARRSGSGDGKAPQAR